MHVTVRELFDLQQRAVLAHDVDDLRVGIPDLHAAEERQRLGVDAVALHGIEDLVVGHAVRLARDEVLHAVGGRRVHDAGAGVERDVVAEVHRRIAVVERVAEADQRQRVPARGRQRRARESPARQARLLAVAGQHQQAAFGVDEVVAEFRMQVERLVGRDRPRRRGPDHRGDRLVGQRREPEGPGQLCALVVAQRESDIDGEIHLVLVLDFGFGQRRAAVKAPVHRLESAEHETLGHDLRQRANLVGLGAEVHRRVRTVPRAEHAEALEVLALPVDLFGGPGARLGDHLARRQVLAVLLLDLDLDRHAVAVPARHVGRVETGHRTALDDDVLQDLVDRGPHVDVVVRVRRSVVQYPARPAHRGSADLLVDLLLVPLADPLRLALREIAAHRKRRVREVQRVLARRGIGRGLLLGVGISHRGTPWPPRALQEVSCYCGGRVYRACAPQPAVRGGKSAANSARARAASAAIAAASSSSVA